MAAGDAGALVGALLGDDVALSVIGCPNAGWAGLGGRELHAPRATSKLASTAVAEATGSFNFIAGALYAEP